MSFVFKTSNEKANSQYKWPAIDSNLSKAFTLFGRFVFKYWCPLSVFGLDNLPAEEPFLVCSNHASHMDSAMIMVALNKSFNKIGLIAAKDYFFENNYKLLLHYMMNLVPIARGAGPKAIKETVNACRSFLATRPDALVIFPEGTRSVNAKISSFKQGSAILAHQLSLPMVPVYVAGSFHSLPKGSFFIRPHNVAVYFGKPIFMSDFLSVEKEKKPFNVYRNATLELEKRVRDLEAMYHAKR